MTKYKVGDSVGRWDTSEATRVTEDAKSTIKRFIRGVTKRLFDVTFALVALMAFSLPMIFVAIVLKFYSRGPVFFSHERVGENGELFQCLKFRTMVVDAKEVLAELLATDETAAEEFARTRKLTNDPRIVPIVGTVLRKTGLDELPQFFNVLLGEMSVVGPRPVPLDEFEENYGQNHPYKKVKPGITGLWQVSGRNDLPYAQRVRLDALYVRNRNLMMDIKIILKTVKIVCVERNGR